MKNGRPGVPRAVQVVFWEAVRAGCSMEEAGLAAGLATSCRDLGRAAWVLGPVSLSCGGGAAWQSAGVAIDDFPRQVARTRRFTLGVPRAVTVSGMAGGCCSSALGAVKTRSRASGGWTWPTAGEDASGFSPIRRRRGTSVLVMCPSPSASGGSGHASSRPGSWPTRPT